MVAEPEEKWPPRICTYRWVCLNENVCARIILDSRLRTGSSGRLLQIW
jgi:hypothetical protein